MIVKSAFIGVLFIAIIFSDQGVGLDTPNSCFATKAAHAGDSISDFDSLIFSWSSSTIQDTLVIADNTYVTCYLWGDFLMGNSGFVGISGTLVQSGGGHVQSWRYVGGKTPIELEIDTAGDAQDIGFLGANCEDIIGKKVLFEFDLYLDFEGVESRPNSRALFGLLPDEFAPFPPSMYFQVYSSDPCGHLILGSPVEVQFAFVVTTAVPVSGTSFGYLKSLYR